LRTFTEGTRRGAGDEKIRMKKDERIRTKKEEAIRTKKNVDGRVTVEL
jgi:hypothetical protein